MHRFSTAKIRPNLFLGFLVGVVLILLLGHWYFTDPSRSSHFSVLPSNISSVSRIVQETNLPYRRQTCSCTRLLLGQSPNLLTIDESSTSLCSEYSTFRGGRQRIIAISMFGPRENALFAVNQSVTYLQELIVDMSEKYPEWILRVYHDATIDNALICTVECAHPNVDFCNTTALGTLGRVSDYIPPKIWRFLPAGDELVEIMASRDLDSPITRRELEAVTDWMASNKSWHAMRDNPMHFVPMLGGMWGFRPALNRAFSRDVRAKMLDRSIVSGYGGRGDQRFLRDQIWPHIQAELIAHDSFLCTEPYGSTSRPWPVRRRHPANDTGCFVGCVRPCCSPTRYPFAECPLACRPKNHPDWTMC